MKAILLGATGLTGSYLLDLLINDSMCDEVIIFTRKSTNTKHPKVKEHIVDLLQLEKQEDLFTADIVFCCIGTTKSKTPDKSMYNKIDYGIPVASAKLSAKNKIKKIVVISALGANENSSIFYNKTKGEMQRDVLKEQIPETYILQPSLIIGDRKEKRKTEKFAEIFMKAIDFITPEKYKMIHGKTIAKAMLYLAYHSFDKTLIESDVIQVLGNKS